MTAQDQQRRADFEAWARTHRILKSHDFALMPGHNEYEEWQLEIAFETWQAARALPAGMGPAYQVNVRSVFQDPKPLAGAFDLPDGTHDLYTAAQVQAMLAQHRAKTGGKNTQNPAQTRVDAGAHRGRGLPSGWQIVPDASNMTDEQAEAIAALANCCGGIACDVYRAALAAAPRPPAVQERAYICPTSTVADLVNNLLLLDQALPIYGAQYIEHPPGKRRAIAIHPTVSRERVKDERWIGEGDELNAAVIWTRAEQPAAPTTGGAADAMSQAQPAMSGAQAVTTGPGSVTAGAARYRLLERGVDTIQASDEFLRDADSTWQVDPNGLFVGLTYWGNALLPARRAIEAAHEIK